MSSTLLVAMAPDRVDAGACAAIVAPVLGAHPSDVAMQIARSDGLFELPLAAEAVSPLAEALRAAGQAWYAVQPTMVPRLPKPLTASSLDPRHDDALRLAVRMTGPPELVDPRRVLAAVPLRWSTTTTQANLPKQASMGSQVTRVAKSVALTGGLSLLGGGGKTASTPAQISISERSLLALVVLDGPGQLRRLHVYADRCDYRVLPAPAPSVDANWRALLEAVRARVRPQQAGAALLDAAIARDDAALWTFGDDNALADRLRWLILRAALLRMGATPA